MFYLLPYQLALLTISKCKHSGIFDVWNFVSQLFKAITIPIYSLGIDCVNNPLPIRVQAWGKWYLSGTMVNLWDFYRHPDWIMKTSTMLKVCCFLLLWNLSVRCVYPIQCNSSNLIKQGVLGRGHKFQPTRSWKALFFSFSLVNICDYSPKYLFPLFMYNEQFFKIWITFSPYSFLI